LAQQLKPVILTSPWFFGGIPDTTWRPAIDVEEKDGTYLLRADLPGMKKKDIHIELHDGYLTLRGERKSEHEEKVIEPKTVELKIE
jgi:HSP20 family molecular chaperone IbpA